MRQTSSILFVLCFFCYPLQAQQDASLDGVAAAKSVHISKINAKITVDGKLDEPVWQTIAPITEFTQTDPDLGKPISEKTEALIFYDEKNIYFGFKCYDSEPKKIIARLGAHDAFTGSDSVDILIDTFHDRRTGFYFSVNARGIQFDALSNEGGANGSAGNSFDAVHNQSWDGVWYSAAAREPWGWSAEVIIPFRSIRVSKASEQVWGLNLNRSIVRKNEVASWVMVTRFDATMKPSKSGTLTGLSEIKVGHNLQFIPFAITRYRRAPWQPQHDGGKATGGADLRYGISGNLTANFSVNPDFGDTESDEFQPQLSRFETFFPEKRQFFTEGANYYATPLNLFFSRRIGAILPDGDPQRILEGGKITGKSERWTVGALEAITEHDSFINPDTGAQQVSPSAFFGVLRLQRDILKKSAIGFISVNRVQKSGDVGQKEFTNGFDLSILSGAHISWQSQFAANVNDAHPGFTGKNLAWLSVFNYNSELWEYNAGFKYLGNRFDVSNTGFEPEVGRYSGNQNLQYKPYIKKLGIRQVFVELNYDEANDTDGAMQDSGADVVLRAQFNNFWNLQTSYSYDRIRFNEFTPAFVRLNSTVIYSNPKYRATLSSNQNRALSFVALYTSGKTVQFNENFHAFIRQWNVSGRARIGNHLRLELTGVHINESLLDGQHFQNRRFLITRLLYQITPKWRARVLAQYADDKRHSSININSLLAYDFTARSAFFVGYNRQRNYTRQPTDLGNEVFVKLSYLFSF